MIDRLDAMDEGDEDLLALVIAEFETLKASFGGDRSAAGRYAAQIRWGNTTGGGAVGKDFAAIENARSARDRALGYDSSLRDESSFVDRDGTEYGPFDMAPLAFPLGTDLTRMGVSEDEKQRHYATVRHNKQVVRNETDAARMRADGTVDWTVPMRDPDNYFPRNTMPPHTKSSVSDLQIGDRFTAVSSDTSMTITGITTLAGGVVLLDGMGRLGPAREKLLAGDTVAKMNDVAKWADAMDKASFGGDRSAAGRYAAQIRWGNRGAAGSSNDGLDATVVMEPTFDISEAIATGRPYAPLVGEHFPADLQELERQVMGLSYNEIMVYNDPVVRAYTQRLREHYMGAIDAGLGHVTEDSSNYAKRLKESPERREDLALDMVSFRVIAIAEQSQLRDRGEVDRAMKITSAFIDGDKNKRITVSAHEDDALAILGSGRITTQFETGTSSGSMNLAARAAHEATGYGVHPFTAPAVRPIYGSLHPYGVQHMDANTSGQYGKVHFVMKNTVIDRSTATIEDSLDQHLFASPARKATRPQVHSRSGWDPEDKGSPEKLARDMKRGENYDYVEAQIRGGVSLKDVAYIAVSGRVTPQLRAAAKERGLEIRELVGEQIQGNRLVFPRLDDADVAKALDAMDKARERRFSSRSEAGRYAAQVRWGNRGASGSGGKPPTGLVMEPTNDVAEAIATGRPYAPLLEENFPDDLKAMQAEVSKLKSAEITPTTPDSPEIVSRYRQRLREHYETVLADGLEQAKDDQPPSVMVEKALSNNPGFSRIMARNMADEQMRRDAQRAYIRDKIGEQRAMEFTAAAIDGSSRKRITVSAHEDDALRILNDGRVKTQFETATSNGMLSVQTRASHEAVAYGVHPFANPQVRPVYGSLHPYGVRHAEQNRSEQYGRVHFVMKDAVIDRSTASAEDSLGTVLSPNPARKAVQPQFSSRGLIPKELSGSAEDVARRHKEGRYAAYAEAQIHGGVRLGDIAYIAISEPPKASRALREAAKRRGLEIKTLTSAGDASYNERTFPALDDTGLAKAARPTLDMTVFLSDAIEKARERRFGSRSEAGRYAANIRWQGRRGDDPDGLEARVAEMTALAEARAQIGDPFDDKMDPAFKEVREQWKRINNGEEVIEGMGAHDAIKTIVRDYHIKKAEERGLHAPCQVATAQEADALLATGRFMVVYRGASPENHESFTTGKPQVGYGHMGPGMYTSPMDWRAAEYAEKPGMEMRAYLVPIVGVGYKRPLPEGRQSYEGGRIEDDSWGDKSTSLRFAGINGRYGESENRAGTADLLIYNTGMLIQAPKGWLPTEGQKLWWNDYSPMFPWKRHTSMFLPNGRPWNLRDTADLLAERNKLKSKLASGETSSDDIRWIDRILRGYAQEGWLSDER